MNHLTTEEAMALAVLRGDRAAALALADSLTESRRLSQIVPFRRIGVDRNSLRIALFLDQEVNGVLGVNERVAEVVGNWIDGRRLLILPHWVRWMEIYEFPK